MIDPVCACAKLHPEICYGNLVIAILKNYVKLFTIISSLQIGDNELRHFHHGLHSPF